MSTLLAAAAAAGPNPLITIVPWILIFVIFWMFMIRPQQKRAREHQASIMAVKKGDKVITGGGLIGNVPRILPEKTRAVIERASWPRPAVFEWLQREGKVAEAEMHRVFNCGIGMAVVVAAEHADAAARVLSSAGETVFRIGRIEARKGAEPQVLIA